MRVVKHIIEIKDIVLQLRRENKLIGLVPTMGALHKGHIELVKRSIRENNVTIVSIFVNPTQFNNLEDLQTYPRSLKTDLAKLRAINTDLVFVPSEDEIYPEFDKRVFDFGYINQIMEGEKRPGHFNGVAQIVSKLFDVLKPHRAYFGQKDFQQVVIIKQLVKQLNFNIEIVTCPIVREKDGLAMSSRNLLLSSMQRKNACQIYQTLYKARNLAGNLNVLELKNWVVSEINQNPHLTVEYFEIIDNIHLKPVQSWDEGNVKVGCIAVQVGEIRLIDNINF